MSIHELMYGMMLPSGNDAAQTLAIYIGNYLLKAEKSGKTRGPQAIDGNIYEEDYPEDEEQLSIEQIDPKQKNCGENTPQEKQINQNDPETDKEMKDNPPYQFEE